MVICTSICAFGQVGNDNLYKAVVAGDSIAVKQLLSDKADPNYIKAAGPWMKVNVLITAVNNGSFNNVKMLVANKANVKWRDGFNTTALMYAAAGGRMDIVNLLLSSGADINDNDGKGNTVLTAAKESKNKELVTLIEGKVKGK